MTIGTFKHRNTHLVRVCCSWRLELLHNLKGSSKVTLWQLVLMTLPYFDRGIKFHPRIQDSNLTKNISKNCLCNVILVHSRELQSSFSTVMWHCGFSQKISTVASYSAASRMTQVSQVVSPEVARR